MEYGRRRRSQLNSDTSNQELGRKHKPDYWLLTIPILLFAIGMVVVFAISPALAASSGDSHTKSSDYVIKQLIAITLSIIVFAITSQIPLKTWRTLQKPLLIAGVLATSLALILPRNPAYPAKRWISLGSFSLQPIELVKFGLLFWLASFLAKQIADGKMGDFKATLKPLLGMLLIVGLVVANPKLQSDLGSTGVIVAMAGIMAFVAGLPMKRIMLIFGILIIGVILVVLPSAYRRDRLTNFMHPEANCQTTGWQQCQAMIAVGSGGMIGVGLGRSVQANGYVPEAANDSIFAIYAEIFGFVGVIVLLGLFLALFNRLKRVAERAPDNYSRLLTIGVLSWLSVQTLINIGAMIGLLPLKGITLPFISYGGTSMVFVAAAIGLVFQISRYTSFVAPTEERSSYDDHRDRRRVRGHITPVLAVAKALKQRNPQLHIVYIGQTGDGLLDIVRESKAIDEVKTIRAGKFRRYHGEGWRQILDLPTQAMNVRDLFYIVIGCWQSWRLLGKYRPTVIFTRGGFVSVPVAFGAVLRHIPYFTHDSDSTPSLANRLIARWARLHTVALPEELYPYPKSTTKTVGIPVSDLCQPVNAARQAEYRRALGLARYEQVLLVTGGGNGAAKLNSQVVANAAYLMKQFPKLAIIHFSGRGLEQSVQQGYTAALAKPDVARVTVIGFSTDFYSYSGAADLIIARGGATNLAEFAIQAKACIVIPPPQLIWAIRNTEALAERQAIVYLTEAQAEQEQRLGRIVADLLAHTAKRTALAHTLHDYAKPDAARIIADLLLETTNTAGTVAKNS